jgi:hypothetical protein
MAIEPVGAPAALSAPVPAALQVTPDDELKRVRLVKMKRVATLMLVGVALLFVATRWLEASYPWLGFVRAFAEAAMVGGIADWFAVTALFRHPLGIPIPHTAIVASRKDRIGTALGNFVQRNFLTRDVVVGKIAAMQLGDRAAQWLARPENSRRLARHAAHGLSGAVSVMHDDDVQEMVDRGIVSRLRGMQAAPLMARLFELMTTGGRHQALLDDALRLAAKFLYENEAMIRERVKAESPWWVPGAVDSRVGDKIVSGVEKTLVAVAAISTPMTLQPLHPIAQIRLHGLHSQMKMVAHDHKRMEPPAKPLRRFEQTGLKRLRRTLPRKQVAPVVPAINHVITGPGPLDSHLARHDLQKRQSLRRLSRVNT